MSDIFSLGQKQTKQTGVTAAWTARRSAKESEITKAFMTAKVLEYDYIWWIQCGGSAMFQRTLATVYRMYPKIRERMHASLLDFATEADDKLTDFDIMPLGQAVNGRLKDIMKRTDLPWSLLSTDERATVDDFAAKFPAQTFDDGAGACPALGKLGMLAAIDDTIEYVKAIFDAFKQQGAKRVLPIIVLGAGGGTGMGIFPLVERIVEKVGKDAGLLGQAGMVRLVFADLAYGYQLYDELGKMTENAELIRERCKKAWETHQHSIFVMSEIGADGLLATLHSILEGKLIMNNNVSNGGFPNAVVSGHDTPAWKLHRIASDQIDRGAEPTSPISLWKVGGWGKKKTLYLNPLPLQTVRDYAVAHRLLQKNRAGAELAKALKAADVAPGNVSNYNDWSNLAAAELTRIQSMADHLRHLSRANGAYTLPHESDLALLVMSADINDIVAGSYSIPRGERTLQHMVPGGILFRKSFPMGDAIVLFEQGKLPYAGAEAELIPITYEVISREDQERAAQEMFRNDVKESLFDD